MADTKAQNEAEFWIRRHALQEQFGQQFTKRSLVLTTGGEFSFDAVSEDGKIVAAISTSVGTRPGGKDATAKLLKIRSDVLWFYMLERVPERKMLVFSEQSMVDLVEKEKKKGRFPLEFEILKVELPSDIAVKVAESQRIASEEVSPKTHKHKD
jgi:hypothetical protein